MSKKKIIILILLEVLIDRLIKSIIVSNISLYQVVKVIPHFFALTYLQNTGAAFNILSSNTYLLIIIALICLIFLFKYLFNSKIDHYDLIALIMIIGGIIGNLIDRIFLKYVIDYLSFTIFNYEFAIFNFADSLIVIGVVILIINNFREEGKYDCRRR